MFKLLSTDCNNVDVNHTFRIRMYTNTNKPKQLRTSAELTVRCGDAGPMSTDLTHCVVLPERVV